MNFLRLEVYGKYYDGYNLKYCGSDNEKLVMSMSNDCEFVANGYISNDDLIGFIYDFEAHVVFITKSSYDLLDYKLCKILEDKLIYVMEGVN